MAHDSTQDNQLVADVRRPLLSVIIRSTDRAWLTDALESVAWQTYPHIEVLVVNAKGSGHSPIGERCGRFPLRMEETGSPLGRSQAANLGLVRAKGELVIFLDDDDWFDPDHLANLAESLTNSPNDVGAYAGVRCVDGLKKPIGTIFKTPYCPAQLHAGNFIPIHAMLFRRSLVEKGCRFDEQLELFEDWDFWLQLATFGNFGFVDRISAAYRITDAGGFGLRSDAVVVRAAALRIVAKWRNVWTDDELLDMMNQAREKRELQTAIARVSPGGTAESLAGIVHDLQERQGRLERELAAREHEVELISRSRALRLTGWLRSKLGLPVLSRLK